MIHRLKKDKIEQINPQNTSSKKLSTTTKPIIEQLNNKIHQSNSLQIKINHQKSLEFYDPFIKQQKQSTISVNKKKNYEKLPIKQKKEQYKQSTQQNTTKNHSQTLLPNSSKIKKPIGIIIRQEKLKNNKKKQQQLAIQQHQKTKRNKQQHSINGQNQHSIKKQPSLETVNINELVITKQNGMAFDNSLGKSNKHIQSANSNTNLHKQKSVPPKNNLKTEISNKKKEENDKKIETFNKQKQNNKQIGTKLSNKYKPSIQIQIIQQLSIQSKIKQQNVSNKQGYIQNKKNTNKEIINKVRQSKENNIKSEQKNIYQKQQQNIQSNSISSFKCINIKNQQNIDQKKQTAKILTRFNDRFKSEQQMYLYYSNLQNSLKESQEKLLEAINTANRSKAQLQIARQQIVDKNRMIIQMKYQGYPRTVIMPERFHYWSLQSNTFYKPKDPVGQIASERKQKRFQNHKRSQTNQGIKNNTKIQQSSNHYQSYKSKSTLKISCNDKELDPLERLRMKIAYIRKENQEINKKINIKK